MASFITKCPAPDDYIPRKSYPLFLAREVLEELFAARGSPNRPDSRRRRCN